MNELLHHAFSLWLQPTCFLCETSLLSGMLCPSCNTFPALTEPLCLICGDPLSVKRVCGKCEGKRHLIRPMRSAYWLNESIQKILHEIKFFSDYPFLLFLIESHLSQISFPPLKEDTWIIPVPLYRESYLERGFNQSECLARKIGKKLKRRVVSDALIKVRKTDRQSWLNILQRQKNLKDAFQWNPKYVAPKSVLIVDDVYTTGSTLRECARVLRKQKVKSIAGWTFLRTARSVF